MPTVGTIRQKAQTACYGPIVPTFGTISAHPCPGTSSNHGDISRIRYPLFCRTFRLFWHSQTTNDDYLGVEINEFAKNSIDSGAASAGWSCFANVEEKKSFKM